MPDDDLADAIALLRQKRAHHLSQVERIDAALTALAAVINEPDRPQRTAEVTRGALERRADRSDTARGMAVALAEEEDRDWSVPEMMEEFARRGQTIVSTNPTNAIRSALVTAVRLEQLYRTATGRYKATKFREENVMATPAGFMTGAVLKALAANVHRSAQSSPPNGHQPAEEEVSTS